MHWLFFDDWRRTSFRGIFPLSLCAIWLLAATTGHAEERRAGNRPPARLVQDRSRKENSSSTKKPAPLGFGVKTEKPTVGGFGEKKESAAEEPSKDRSRSRDRRERSRQGREERPREEQPRDDKPRDDKSRDGGESRSESSGRDGGGNRQADNEAKFQSFAKSILARHDQNKNGILDGDEWKGLGSQPEKYDVNGDGRITHDEIVAFLASYGKKNESSGGGSSKPASSGTSSRSSDPPRREPDRGRPAERSETAPRNNEDGGEEPAEDRPRRTGGRRPTDDEGPDGRGSEERGSDSRGSDSRGRGPGGRGPGGYGPGPSDGGFAPRGGGATGRGKRFLTPTERLPEGLPSFFVRSDADGDGQITMAEFASGWSDSKVSEFNKYDLNGDGVITPAEALASEKKRR